jgi:hypothetical protein
MCCGQHSDGRRSGALFGARASALDGQLAQSDFL